MRIISGQFKGRHFFPPQNISARPTTDFAKEGLFNLLVNRIDFEDIAVLDLFAGTGGIGFEFVSRGCSSVVAVEIENLQVGFIRKICNDLQINNLSIVKRDVFQYLNRCELRFDFIYADPPYALPQLATIPDLIFQKEILKQNGMFVLEHSAKNDFSMHPHFVEMRKYGNVHFSFFK